MAAEEKQVQFADYIMQETDLTHKIIFCIK